MFTHVDMDICMLIFMQSVTENLEGAELFGESEVILLEGISYTRIKEYGL